MKIKKYIHELVFEAQIAHAGARSVNLREIVPVILIGFNDK